MRAARILVEAFLGRFGIKYLVEDLVAADFNENDVSLRKTGRRRNLKAQRADRRVFNYETDKFGTSRAAERLDERGCPLGVVRRAHMAYGQLHFIRDRGDTQARSDHFRALNLRGQRKHKLLIAPGHGRDMKRIGSPAAPPRQPNPDDVRMIDTIDRSDLQEPFRSPKHPPAIAARQQLRSRSGVQWRRTSRTRRATRSSPDYAGMRQSR